MDGEHSSVKGTSSVLNGYEALTGQINVEYKKPAGDEKVAANVFVSSTARAEVNANTYFDVAPGVSTGLLVHASDEFVEWDHNNDGFLDMPRVSQYNLIDRWYIKKGIIQDRFLLVVCMSVVKVDN